MVDIDKEIEEYTKKLKDIKQNYETTIQAFSKDLKIVDDKTRSAYSRMNYSLYKTINAPQGDKTVFTCCSWGGEGNKFETQIAATTNKGYVYLYDINKKAVVEEINIVNNELKTCCIEPQENNLLAAGGFDGGIYVTNINGNTQKDKKDQDDFKKFNGHQGEISSCKFISPVLLISSSFDSHILLWDINSMGKSISSFRDHNGEVSGLDVNSENGNIFASGSGDTTTKLWDIREKKPCVTTFKGSDSSVSCVKFLPGRLTTLAAGSEDSLIRIYDLRALKELSCVKKDLDFNSINSIGFSKSGQILFASSNNSSKINFWDILNHENTPFYMYDHKTTNSNSKGGVKQISIDSSGSVLSYLFDDTINIIK